MAIFAYKNGKMVKVSRGEDEVVDLTNPQKFEVCDDNYLYDY
jgi:hypothetical protein